MFPRPSYSLIALAVLLSCSNARAVEHRPVQCDGLPRLPVKTAPGFCLGLVAEGLKAPRGVLPLPNGDIVVADMGSWEAGRGRIWLLRRQGQAYAKTVLFDRLDRPNSVALGPDKQVYVGMVGRIGRFSADAPKPALVDVVGGASGIPGLPSTGRHLLPAMLFDAQRNLIVSVGSASDHCETAEGNMAPGPACAERKTLGVLRSYGMQWPAGKVMREEVHARGLRNAMAIALDARTGTVWQGENARDAIHAAIPGMRNDNELPHDELNAIVAGGDYGWPYCYDNGRASPEYPKAKCASYRSPARLLPAHAAPLGMVFYTAKQFPKALHQSLILTYHGYRKHGHRIVALLDKPGQGPLGRSITLVDGARKTRHGLGAPVGLGLGPDGGLYVSDDHAGIVARLYYEGRATARP